MSDRRAEQLNEILARAGELEEGSYLSAIDVAAGALNAATANLRIAEEISANFRAALGLEQTGPTKTGDDIIIKQ